jgi:hypothetical protein
MVRALRIASEVAVYAFIAVSAFWPRLPRNIGAALAMVAFIAMCTQIAFRLHDTNLARKDVSLRD